MTFAAKGLLIPPYGGDLVDLRVSKEESEPLLERAKFLPSIQLSARSLCDFDLLVTGGFSPLRQFMGQADYLRVLDEMRLCDGTLFPIPLTLPLPEARNVRLGSEIALCSQKNELLGIMNVEEIFSWDPVVEALRVFGTTDPRHPVVAEMSSWGRYYISGPIKALSLPRYYDFPELRHTPSETRNILEKQGYGNVVAFQTRNPLHRAHEVLTKRAIEEVNGFLLLHPVVGLTKPGDVDHYTRVRTYKMLVEKYFDAGRVLLSLLPLAMRLAGPREAVWHALIRRNYGATHMIIGRDHATPGLNSQGKPFYGPFDAQDLVQQHGDELGIQVLPFSEFTYLPEEDRYEEISKVQTQKHTVSISGTVVREEYLNQGKPLPGWFTRPEVAEILSESYPPRFRQGFCVWFTGLSGSGKSTTAEVLTVMMMETGRQVTVLDGDVVRTHLSQGLGFGHKDRDTNVRRIGFVAAEIVRHGGAVVCAAVSPYRATRNDVRNLIGVDRFIEVFVDTPLEVCEQRDTKGLYAKARSGELIGFTGVNDPYEAPLDGEIVLTTTDALPEENARKIVHYLSERGFLRSGSVSGNSGP